MLMDSPTRISVMSYKRSMSVKTSAPAVVDEKNTAYPADTTIQSFNVQEMQTVHGNSKSVRFVSDIFMLLNQKRLDKVTLQALADYLESTGQSSYNEQLAQLKAKCTDEQLMQYCKSRYIQSPQELLLWSEHLEGQLTGVLKEIEDAKALESQEPKEPSVESKTE